MNCPYRNGEVCPTPHMCDSIDECWDKQRESRGYYVKREPRDYKQLYSESDPYDFWKPIRDLPSEADESPQRIDDARNILPTQEDAGQEPRDTTPGKIR